MSERKDPRRAVVATDTGPPAGMPFIVSLNDEKANPTTRKLIRSHVMRGKKKKKKHGSKPEEPRGAGSSGGPIQRAGVNLEEVVELYMPLLPGRFGMRLYYIDFPDEIDPSVIMQMFQVSTVMRHIIHPLLATIGLQSNKEPAAPYPVAFDAAALHINAYAMENFIDRILRRLPEQNVNRAAALHHQRGLQLLRQKLLGNDDEEKISDATVSVVLKLATAAHFDGDIATSQQHMQGLRKMVDLRGGLSAFDDNPKLRVEMLRCDLSIALLTNSKPLFYLQPSEPVPEYPEQVIFKSATGSHSKHEEELLSTLDEDLAKAWRTTRTFCMLVNLGTQTRRLLPPESIHGTMTAIMYRLFNMGFAAGLLDETIRLGLLAFTHHIFLQWQDVRVPCHEVTAAFRQSLRQHKPHDLVPPETMMWLSMVGAVSLLDISEESWLRDSLREQLDGCQVKTWNDLHDILKSHMWIPLLDKKAGQQIYDSLYK
ncbi:hypothetical protein PG989_001610 [Apiospora arundinis]